MIGIGIVVPAFEVIWFRLGVVGGGRLFGLRMGSRGWLFSLSLSLSTCLFHVLLVTLYLNTLFYFTFPDLVENDFIIMPCLNPELNSKCNTRIKHFKSQTP